MLILPDSRLNNYILKIICQWAVGDWESLGLNKIEKNLGEEVEGNLTALIESAQILSGSKEHVRSVKSLAQSKEQRLNAIRINLSGLLNTLSNVHYLIGDEVTSERLMRESLSLLLKEDNVDLFTKIRLENQQKNIEKYKIRHAKIFNKFRVTNEVKIGEGWSANTINTVIFRHHGIFSSGEFQYTAFYTDSDNIRVVQRNIKTNELRCCDLKGEYNLHDAHNSISLGIDRCDRIHISYDHHASRLKYRRSLNSHDITLWTNEVNMTGRYEDKLTYPTFILPRNDYPLTLIYRHGVHDRGAAYIKTYNEKIDEWKDHPHPLFSGNESKPWTSNAYWNHPAIGYDGSIFLSFVWRNNAVGTGEKVNNVNIGFACSFNNGESWLTSNLEAYRIPISQTSSEVIYSIPPCSNLMNQTSMAVDSMNRPHIVFYSNDYNDIPQYQHLWFDGRKWCHQFISKRKDKFDLKGGGTLNLPMSRPEIVIDECDNVVVIFRADYTNNKFSYLYLEKHSYCWSGDFYTLLDLDVGYSEPIIDRNKWNNAKILSMYIQKCNQPDNDLIVPAEFSSCFIVDFEFKKEFNENEKKP